MGHDGGRFLITQRAAACLGLSSRTMDGYRVSCEGPAFRRFGTECANAGPIWTCGWRIRLPVVGWVRMLEAVRFSGALKRGSVSREPQRRYASVLIDTDDVHPVEQPWDTVGVDLGVTALATLSDGATLPGAKAHKRLLQRLRRHYRALSQRTVTCGSCNYEAGRDHNAARNLQHLATSSAVSACGEECAGAERKPRVQRPPGSRDRTVWLLHSFDELQAETRRFRRAVVPALLTALTPAPAPSTRPARGSRRRRGMAPPPTPGDRSRAARRRPRSSPHFTTIPSAVRNTKICPSRRRVRPRSTRVELPAGIVGAMAPPCTRSTAHRAGSSPRRRSHSRRNAGPRYQVHGAPVTRRARKLEHLDRARPQRLPVFPFEQRSAPPRPRQSLTLSDLVRSPCALIYLRNVTERKLR